MISFANTKCAGARYEDMRHCGEVNDQNGKSKKNRSTRDRENERER